MQCRIFFVILLLTIQCGAVRCSVVDCPLVVGGASCVLACGIVQIKYPLLLVGKISPSSVTND